MKASEEIAADMFIRRCLERGITSHSNIVEEARQAKGTGSSKVSELLRNDNSIAYEDIKWDECSICNSNLLFDEEQEEHYCPRCES